MATSFRFVLAGLSLLGVVAGQPSVWDRCGGGWGGGKCAVTHKETASTSGSTSTGISTRDTASSAKYLITFGDSYSQTGFDPNGTVPSPSDPIGNPAFPGDTTDNGRNWIGYLVSEYNTSLVLSYNFASGGATVDSNLVQPYASTVLSLVQQVQEFTSTASFIHGPWNSTDTLFGIWIGVNDIGNTYYNDNATETRLLGEIFDQYFAQVQILYDSGARNFVFLAAPPTNRTPNFIAQGSTAQAGVAATISVWNSMLNSRVENFTSTHTSVNARVVDIQPAFNTILDANATAAACYNSDGVSCDWWNDYHPGMRIQDAVATAVAAAWRGSFF